MGCAVAYIDKDQRCFTVDLAHQDLLFSVQTHQASCILPPLFSVLRSFARQWFGILLCTLQISSTPSGVSLDVFHSAANGEGEMPSKDAAHHPWVLQLGHLSLSRCCCLSLWLMRLYWCPINYTLICLGLEHHIALQSQSVPAFRVASLLQLLISGSQQACFGSIGGKEVRKSTQSLMTL